VAESSGKPVVRSRKRRWLLWLLAAVVGVLLVGAGLYLWIYGYVVQSVAARRVQEVVERVWDGPVVVRAVKMGHTGVIRAKRIEFYDELGEVVVEARGVRLRMEKWLSANPVILEEDIEEVDVWLRASEQGVNLPLRIGDKADGKRWSVRRVRIGEVDVQVAGSELGRIAWDGLDVELQRAEKGYEVSVNHGIEEERYQLAIDGILDELTGELDITLKLEQVLLAPQTAVMKEILGLPGEWIGRGEVDTDLALRGRLDNIRGMVRRGRVRLSGWSVNDDGRELVEGLEADVDVNDTYLALTDIRASACGGRVEGACSFDAGEDGISDIQGRLLIKDVRTAELTELLFGQEKLSAGKITGQMEFVGGEPGIANIQGRGVVFIDNADMGTIPVVGKMLAFVGLEKLGMVEMSDAEVSFGVSDGVVTIERGHMSNKLSAIEAEPGGTVDMVKGEVDMRVIVLVVKGIDETLRSIPVVNIFSAVKDKLTRLRVKGHWSEPTGKLISKEPVRDIAAGTVEFFGGVVRSGGQFTDGVRQMFDLVFNGGGDDTEVGEVSVYGSDDEH